MTKVHLKGHRPDFRDFLILAYMLLTLPQSIRGFHLMANDIKWVYCQATNCQKSK